MKKILAIAAASCIFLSAKADYGIDYEASFIGTASTGTFSPFYINSLRHGKIISPNNTLVEGKAWRPMELDKRFSYSFGVDFLTGWSSGTDYSFYTAETGWGVHNLTPPRIWLHQLYGEVKYRSLFLSAGLKERSSALLNERLSSGDLTESGNARPIPQVRIGFIDFQNIPFTNGWVQIQGEVAYGKMTDSDWWLDHYNYFNYHVTKGQWFNYKRCYFRTKPSQPFSITIGLQAGDTFGGTRYAYREGQLTHEPQTTKITFKSLLNALIPMEGSGEAFYEGNHLGSWDFMARYALRDGSIIKAYFQWPWEDGTGIGRMNGWDGLWGLEWKNSPQSTFPIKGAVVEYIDMTNQSGPQHYAPGDFPGENIGSQATGCDDYYNNFFYNSYANYGMSIGTPMMMSPVFNTDGYLAYVATRMRGFHAALEGVLSPSLSWRVRGGYRIGYGNGHVILPSPIKSTSVAANLSWDIPQVKGLNLNAEIAYDHGTMPGSSFGTLITLNYRGLLNL